MEKIFNWISTTFSVNQTVASYIFYGAIGFVVLLILLIVILSVKASHKRQAIKVEEARKASQMKASAKAQEPKATSVEPKPQPKPVVKEEVKVQEKVEPKKEEKKVEVKEETKEVKKPRAPKKVEKEVKVEPKPLKETKKPEEKVETKEVKKAYDGKFTLSQEGTNYRYRLKASNGEVLVVSELYASLESCKRGIQTIKKNAETANIEVVEDKHGLFSFRVMSKQGRCFATSANYSTKSSALSAIESFKNFVKTERIEEDEASDHYNITKFNEDITCEENGKFKIIKSDEGFTYQLLANNGQVIATSQTYKTLTTCKNALEKFRELAYTENFLIFEDKNKKYQFKLYNKQNRLVLAGEVYDTKDRAISVIESIKRFAKLAEIVED